MTSCEHRAPAGRVTLLVPTANRPAHLYRFLRYYADHATAGDLPILVADSSAPDQAERFEAMASGIAPGLSYRLTRHAPEIGFFEKLRLALRAVSTDYVMLAADDDFFFIDWIDKAVAHLDDYGDTTAVIGNYMVFGLDGFTAFSHDVNVRDGSPERFTIPWLEGGSVDERVGEIARNRQGIQTIGWYALHRTATVRGIVEHLAGHDGMPLLLAERFFTVAQAAAGKTRFTPAIFLARQSNVDPAHRSWRAEPLGLAANRDAVEAMRERTRSYLAEALGLDEARARQLVERVFEFEIVMMRQADRRRITRRLVDKTRLRRLITRWRAVAPAAPRDPRLPAGCDPNEMAQKAAIVRFACLPDEDRA